MQKIYTLFFCLFILFQSRAQSFTVLGSGANAISNQSYIFSITTDGLGNVYAGCGYPAGGIMSGHVEKWNGTTWSELLPDDSVLLSGSVRSVTTDAANNVYAAGDFSDPFVSGFDIAKWNGSYWSEVNNFSNPHYCNATIFALAHDNNNHIYAGEFYQNLSFDTSYFYVATWDGANWVDLEGGPNLFHVDSVMLSITTDANNNVYAAGEFTDSTGHFFVGHWNGTGWSELGGFNSLQANSTIYALTTDIHGNVYAAGSFTNNTGNPYIAKWDGNVWTDLGNSAHVLQMATQYSRFTALCSDAAGNVYVAGGIKDSTGYYVAKWDGANWTRIYTDSVINSLCVDGNQNVYGAHAGIDYAGIVPNGFVVNLNFPNTMGFKPVEGNLSHINIFPNPSPQQVVIEAMEAISCVELLNPTGQVVFTQHLSAMATKINIDISNLAAGIYFARIQTIEGVAETKKLLKQ